ncbi:helix-turn-helix domain [Caudoviricetes sp.]|nr:helix-turn-helix domain [Caudoviricetes sp.]
MSQLLTPKDLCDRWKISNDTLRKWRVSNTGPAYIKLGDTRNSQVRYRLEDIEAFERSNKFMTNN